MPRNNDKADVDGLNGSENGTSTNENGNDGNDGAKSFSVDDFAPPESKSGTDSPIKRKRGRPAKAETDQTGTEKNEKARVKLSVTGKILAPKIQGLHAVLAAITKQKIFELSETECNELGNSIAEIINHYGLKSSVTGVIWGNFLVCVGMIYYPRYLILQQQKKQENV